MAMNLVSANSQSQTDTALREQLLFAVNEQMREVNALAERLQHVQQMAPQQCMQFAKALYEATAKVIAAGNWEESLFLRNTIKPIKAIHVEAEQIIKQLSNEGVESTYSCPQAGASQKLVYVSLFQNQGFDMTRWEMQLRSLHKYLLGRPVYADREQVEKALRIDAMHARQAYVVIAVSETDIQQNQAQLDKHGNALLTLSDAALQPNNILEFVHLERHYTFVNGKLRLQTSR